MKRISIRTAIGGALLACVALAQGPSTGPNKIVKRAKTGGDGGFDYIYADVDGRKLYIPRTGQQNARIDVFNLDTLAPVGSVPNANARGAATDAKSGHGFVSSSPVVMFDTKTLAVIKTIPVEGGPDGILGDPFNQRIYIFSHRAPNATVINAVDGTVVGTIDLGGAPEQAVTDGKGHIYVDIEDKDNIAVVDAKTMAVTAHYDIKEKGGGPGGLGIDAKNGILFAACHDPAVMVILKAVGRQDHHDPASRWFHGWRGLQPRHHGSVQLAGRRHADGDQREQPDQFCRGADGADNDGRQDDDHRHQDQPGSDDGRRSTGRRQLHSSTRRTADRHRAPAGAPGGSGADRGRGRGPGRGADVARIRSLYWRSERNRQKECTMAGRLKATEPRPHRDVTLHFRARCRL